MPESDAGKGPAVEPPPKPGTGVAGLLLALQVVGPDAHARADVDCVELAAFDQPIGGLARDVEQLGNVDRTEQRANVSVVAIPLEGTVLTGGQEAARADLVRLQSGRAYRRPWG